MDIFMVFFAMEDNRFHPSGELHGDIWSIKSIKSGDKKAINDAAKNITLAFQNKYSHMDEGDSSLLPAGFNAKKADCLILSVALKYKKEDVNPILLTSDNILQSRALGLGILTISLRDFLAERK